MDFMGKDIKDIVVTLPLADGTEMDCGVFASFAIDGNTYLVLLPLLDEKTLDYTKSFMIYKTDEDEEHNPVVAYIEDDAEYAKAAQYFTDNYLSGSRAN